MCAVILTLLGVSLCGRPVVGEQLGLLEDGFGGGVVSGIRNARTSRILRWRYLMNLAWVESALVRRVARLSVLICDLVACGEIVFV